MEKFVWVVLCFLHLLVGGVYGAQIPAMFVFGDSLIDPGNNNYLATVSRANFPPNGIDFPAGTTGRFSNGATVADYLGFSLGFDLIPAVNDPNTQGTKVLQGVNFASSSAGILNDTGSIYGKILSMHEQVELFANKILPILSSQVLSFNGERLSVDDYLAKSLFLSEMGANDFLNTYLLPIANPLRKPIPPTYADSLIKEYKVHLKNLYKYGARKILVAGLPPVGCSPTVIASFSDDLNQCYEPHNQVVFQFNAKINALVQQLNNELPSANFLFWDLYPLAKKIIDNPSEYGFKYSHIACCGAGKANGQILCNPAALLCLDRSEFTFWDLFHPSASFNKIASSEAYQGKLQDVHPMNVKQLLRL